MPPKDPSQQTSNLILAGQIERVFKEAVGIANQSQHDRQTLPLHQTATTSSSAVIDVDKADHENDDANAGRTVAAPINISKDARIAANRAANISVLMLGALAADAKIMDVPSNFGGNNNKFQSANMINADNVFSALNKAGFGHLVDPCKKAIFEEVDTSDNTVLGIRRQRGQV